MSEAGPTSTHHLVLGPTTVRKRYVSWDDDEPTREWAGLVALAAGAPGLAPQPITRESEHGAPVIVMSRLPGEPLGGAPLTREQTEGLVEALGRLFAAPVPAGAEPRAYGPADMRAHTDRWAAAWADAHADLSACQDRGLVAEALATARAWVSTPDPGLDRVQDPVLALGDGNLANVLWDGAACRLLDFEEFGVSDLAYEVADLTEHASSRLRGLLDVEHLVDLVGLDDAQRRRWAGHRGTLAAFWLVMLLPGHRGFDRNPPGSTEHQARHLLALP